MVKTIKRKIKNAKFSHHCLLIIKEKIERKYLKVQAMNLWLNLTIPANEPMQILE